MRTTFDKKQQGLHNWHEIETTNGLEWNPLTLSRQLKCQNKFSRGPWWIKTYIVSTFSAMTDFWHSMSQMKSITTLYHCTPVVVEGATHLTKTALPVAKWWWGLGGFGGPRNCCQPSGMNVFCLCTWPNPSCLCSFLHHVTCPGAFSTEQAFPCLEPNLHTNKHTHIQHWGRCSDCSFPRCNCQQCNHLPTLQCAF